METDFLPCPTCRAITLAEVPPCDDDHGARCPDRACTVCGTALTLSGQLIWGDLLTVTGTATRPGTGRAA